MSGSRSKHLKLAVQIVRKVSAAHRAGPRTCCVDADAVQNGRISDVRALRPNRKDVSRECRVSILSEEKPGWLQFLRDRHCLAESPNPPPAVHSTGIRRIGEKRSLPTKPLGQRFRLDETAWPDVFFLDVTSGAEDLEKERPPILRRKDGKGAEPSGAAPFPDKARSDGRLQRTARRSDRQLPNHLR